MPTRRETIEGWATQMLLNAHAIEVCPGCGFRRLKSGHRGLEYAHGLVEIERYPGKSKVKCIEAIDAVFDSLGDDCGGC